MTNTENTVLAHLSSAAREGRLGELQIEYWTGGGQPPPYYRSEQFRLLAREAKPMMEFAVMRFSPKLTPQDFIERYTRLVGADTVQSVAKTLWGEKVFETDFAEEHEQAAPGMIAHQIIATVGGERLKKVFPRTMPKALAALEAQFQKLIANVRQHGERSWLHQGKPIADPFAAK